MRTFEDEPIRLYQGPGWFSVFLISLTTSFAVAVGVQWAIQRGMFPALRQAPAGAPQTAPAPTPAATPARDSAATTSKVPMLAGMPLAMANQALEAHGLKLVVRERRYNDELPADSVISQDPLPDSPVPARSPVAVVVSAGKQNAGVMPDLSGQPLEQVSQALEAAGLKLGAVTGPDAGARIVKSSEPAAGQPVARGASVALTVEARGSAREQNVATAGGVVVPKLIGLPWSKAKKLLQESGLSPGKVRERYDEEYGSYVVLAQTPAPGVQVAPGSGVDIVRNEGD
jgi:serine/threonine-protein kinase